MTKWVILLLVLMGYVPARLKAQSVSRLPVRWQKSFGGSLADVAYTIVRAPDGGYLLGGYTHSVGGGDRRSPSYGFMDYWVVRTDSAGNRLWDRAYGGGDWDHMTTAVSLRDGGFLLGGYSRSTNGVKLSVGYGGDDFWIVRINAQGDVLWERSYGGSYEDWLSSIVATPDGGFLLAGSSLSGATGTKTSTNYGAFDFWVVRIDSTGNQLWARSYGGTNGDLVASARATPDGGFVLAGNSYSPVSGSKTSPAFGDSDVWVVRLDASGNQLWDNAFGGVGSDTGEALQIVSDGGFIIAASSASPVGGNKTAPHYGANDFWAIRLDANGNKLWDRSAGGPEHDLASTVQEGIDGGFLLGGSASDYWLVQLDHQGNRLWDQFIGGDADDQLAAIEHDGQGGFVLLGSSVSAPSGAKTTPNWGALDYWAVNVGGLNAPLRLEPVGRSVFRFPAEPQYLYISERSADLIHWFPFQTNFFTHSPMTTSVPFASAAAADFYRIRLSAAGRAPPDLWRPLVVTGVAGSSRVYTFLVGAGEALIDDIQLVSGGVPGVGLNAIVGGDFESDLGAWIVPSSYAGSRLTTEAYRTGQSSLKLVSDGTPASPATVFQQYALPIQTNTTYTLSLWYLPTTNSVQLTLRLSDNTIAVTTNIQYRPLR